MSAQDVQALFTLGVPGLVFIIVVLCGVIVYQNRQIGQEKAGRLQDAKDIRDKLTGAMEQQVVLLNRIYDAVSSTRRRS